MAAAQQPIVTSQVTEHERATFITQLYKLLQQIVQLSKNIVPDEALLLKVCSLPTTQCARCVARFIRVLTLTPSGCGRTRWAGGTARKPMQGLRTQGIPAVAAR